MSFNSLRLNTTFKDYFPDSITTPSITTLDDDTIQYRLVDGWLEIALDDLGSKILWSPWPESVEKPKVDSGIYHPIRIMGKVVNQPRRTVCYGHSYKYSNNVHPVEEKTPESIQAIMDHTNRVALNIGDENGFNMVLQNTYLHGHHCIGEHSDDERAMKNIKDVVCWVHDVTGDDTGDDTGDASRVGKGRKVIIRRSKKWMRANKKTGSRDVLSLTIPTGIYIMRGEMFQRNFTHEIPRIHDGVMKRIAKNNGISASTMTVMEVADYIYEHRADMKCSDKDLPKFMEWCHSRVSYTLRRFD